MADAWDQFPDAPQAAAAPRDDPWSQFPDAAPPAPAQAAQPPAARQPLVSRGQHIADTLSLFKQHPFTTGVGMLENAVSGIGAGAGMLADTVTGSDPGTHQWAYQPRTEAGQQISELTGQEGAQIGNTYDRAFGTGPLATTLKERIPQALGAVGTVAGTRAAVSGGRQLAPTVGRALRSAPPPTAEAVLSKLNSQQSMGAAAAAPNLAYVSPELKSAVVRHAQKAGGAINDEAFARQMDADTLPVRMNLSEGQATQDPRLISNEMNLRGRNEQLSKHFEESNKKLAQNVQAMRDQVGPEVFSTNASEHADTLISAYRTKHDAAQAEVGKAYQALRDANGGQFPVDAQALLQSASSKLHKDLLYDHAPKAVMTTLVRLAKTNKMSFENFESMRTNLARIQRSATADGNEKAAAGVIRQAMEDLPLSQETAQLKPLADQARSLSRAQFQALDADPAYKAAVEGIDPDKFIAKHVINASRDDLAKLRANLEDNPAAVQTIAVAALDYLREQARLNPHYEGNFAAASYNKALQKLSPKLKSLLPPDVAEQVEKLGRVATYATSQPKGSFVNNSNTFVAGAAGYGASAVEGAVNVAAGGVPVGTWGRRAVNSLNEGRKVRNALAPGAGLNRLREQPKQ